MVFPPAPVSYGLNVNKDMVIPLTRMRSRPRPVDSKTASWILRSTRTDYALKKDLASMCKAQVLGIMSVVWWGERGAGASITIEQTVQRIRTRSTIEPQGYWI